MKEKTIRELLANEGIPLPVAVFDTVDSTNTEARRRLSDGTQKGEPFLILSERQTAGKGRRSRSFYSPAGKGIYMTLVVWTDMALPLFLPVTTAVSVAVCRAAEEVTGKGPLKIKWVNDIYDYGKKVGGILTETFGQGEQKRYPVIIGIGLNVCPQTFPEDIRPIAGTLGVPEKFREPMVARICRILFDMIGQMEKGNRPWMEEYRSRSLVLGQTVTFEIDHMEKEGRVTGITDEGSLEVLTESGKVVLDSGEVTVRLKS